MITPDTPSKPCPLCARKDAQIEAVKAEIARDANLGSLVELLFYAPLREAESENRDLRAQIAALQKDRDRLDWLEIHRTAQFWSNGNGKVSLAPDESVPRCVEGETLRAAIDAAMKH